MGPIGEEVEETAAAELAVIEPKIGGRDWRQVFVDAELAIDLAADPAELAAEVALDAEVAPDAEVAAEVALVESPIGSPPEVGLY